MPRPRAILVVSAHWYINATAVTAMPRPRTIHDFYGFPQELFDVQYPAPGLPELAAEVSDAVQPTWVGADVDSWGIDHGTWSVLVHAFPDADIPVVQLSINADKAFDYHLDLGARLAACGARGVLVVASGNVVHNLRGMSWELADAGYDWAQRFDEDAKARMLDDPAAVTRLDEHRDFRERGADARPLHPAAVPRRAGQRGRGRRRRAGRRLHLRLAVDDRLHARDGLPRALRRDGGHGGTGADCPARREQHLEARPATRAA